VTEGASQIFSNLPCRRIRDRGVSRVNQRVVGIPPPLKGVFRAPKRRVRCSTFLLQLVVNDCGRLRAGNQAIAPPRQCRGVIGESSRAFCSGLRCSAYFFPGTSVALFGATTSAPITIISQIRRGAAHGFRLERTRLWACLGAEEPQRRRRHCSDINWLFPVLGVRNRQACLRASSCARHDPLVSVLFCGIGLAIYGTTRARAASLRNSI